MLNERPPVMVEYDSGLIEKDAVHGRAPSWRKTVPVEINFSRVVGEDGMKGHETDARPPAITYHV